MHPEFWCGTRKETDYLKDLGVDGRITLKWILDMCERTWTGFIRLRIWTRGWLLLTQV
jgi:hypothetical protein